jgi:hypothetical protein
MHTKAEPQELKKQVDELEKENICTRFDSIADFLKSNDYKNGAKTGLVQVDETFNVNSRLLLTVVLFSSKIFLSENGEPAVFVLAYMLSFGRSKDDFQWLGECLTKEIKHTSSAFKNKYF